jgi:ribosomal protein S3
MTRIVNATIFRLGYSKKWASAWMNSSSSFYRKFLHEDYVIYRFVTIFFTKYTMESFGWGIPRVFPGTKGVSTKASGLEIIVNNPLIEGNFSFSHLSLGRSASLDISCFFLDSSLETWRTGKYKMRNHSSHNIFFPKMYRHSFFSENKVSSKLLRHGKVLNSFKFLKRLLKRITIFRSRPISEEVSEQLNRLLKEFTEVLLALRNEDGVNEYGVYIGTEEEIKKIKNIILVKTKSILRMVQRKPPKKVNSKLLYPSFIYSNLKATVSFHIPVYKKKFKLLKILFLLFSHNLSYNMKKQFFFTVLLKTIMLSLVTIREFSSRLLKSVPFLKFISLLRIKEYSFQHLNFFFFRTVIKNRFFIFNCASFAISQSLKAFDKNEKINISYYGLHIRNITASYILKFILFQLRAFFTIQEIFRTLLKDLQSNSNIKGYRIVVAGRLTRAERAAYMIEQTKNMTLGTKVVFIDYAADFVILRFGLVGVKVWLNYVKFRPFFYKFSFFIRNIKDKRNEKKDIKEINLPKDNNNKKKYIKKGERKQFITY